MIRPRETESVAESEGKHNLQMAKQTLKASNEEYREQPWHTDEGSLYKRVQEIWVTDIPGSKFG